MNAPARHGRTSWILLPLLLLVLGWLLLRMTSESTAFLPKDDFSEYWSAGKVCLNGKNPYDREELFRTQNREDIEDVVMMWNPPWTLPLLMPLGTLEFRTAQTLWFLLNLALLLVSADQLWLYFGGDPERRWQAWLLALGFAPSIFLLWIGQISAWMLGGLTLFLRLESSDRKLTAGMATILLAVKPHLVLLFWLVLLIRACRGELRVAAGAVVAGGLFLALAMAFNPDVLWQYQDALRNRPPSQWESPTIGTILRKMQGGGDFSLQFVPVLLALGWFAADARMQRGADRSWRDRIPMLLLISVVTAAYGAWPFDMVILLPVVIRLAVVVSGSRRPVYFVVMSGYSLAALLVYLLRLPSLWYIWLSPGLLLIHGGFSRVGHSSRGS
jgi:Glycosyltransferase family 87